MEINASTCPRPAPYRLRLPDLKPDQIPQDVMARKGNKDAWPVLLGISIAEVEIPVGTSRALHYHINTPEISVILCGTARAGLISPDNKIYQMDLLAGDCVYFPTGWPHWLRNTGNEVVRAYFNYGCESPVTVEVGNLTEHLAAAEKDWPLRGHRRLVTTETE